MVTKTLILEDIDQSMLAKILKRSRDTGKSVEEVIVDALADFFCGEGHNHPSDPVTE